MTTSIYSVIKGNEVVNFRAGFASNGPWEAFVSVKNAFNDRYLNNITIVSGNTGLVVGTPADDRTVSFTVRARY